MQSQEGNVFLQREFNLSVVAPSEAEGVSNLAAIVVQPNIATRQQLLHLDAPDSPPSAATSLRICATTRGRQTQTLKALHSGSYTVCPLLTASLSRTSGPVIGKQQQPRHQLPDSTCSATSPRAQGMPKWRALCRYCAGIINVRVRGATKQKCEGGKRRTRGTVNQVHESTRCSQAVKKTITPCACRRLNAGHNRHRVFYSFFTFPRIFNYFFSKTGLCLSRYISCRPEPLQTTAALLLASVIFLPLRICCSAVTPTYRTMCQWAQHRSPWPSLRVPPGPPRPAPLLLPLAHPSRHSSQAPTCFFPSCLACPL